ncbi:peptidoglycan DD-metalloendopeptidase family protein [Marinomonas ostreistagni]|uniref:Peptidoglycan DD-metalloendopeptidase family protein n=1 Tax=Marinomonas ostreistagni TaxID=359209 RepID=A0ABS0Z6R9_9GAMM|nr:peptidoglycan DD-metalloendopeptidase family protein [Marinomonas ostreistagni]
MLGACLLRNIIRLFILLTQRFSVVAIACFLIVGCASDSFHYSNVANSRNSSTAPSTRSIPSSGIHRVQSGDTLFSIAFSYGLDYRNVASINGIAAPYIIYPNQKIRLRGSASRTASTASTSKTKPSTSAPKTVTKKTTEKVNSSSRPVSTVNIPEQKVSSWHWPIVGAVTKSFSNAGVSSKGIDIKGKNSEHVKAAADGVVVYAGNGLIGYGNLVIVKHNDVYLSAYAYNDRILVKEKQSVRAGDSLAIIGGKGSERPLLHFEVRRDGQPIDPLKVLPKQ